MTAGKPGARERFFALLEQGWSKDAASREVGIHPRTGQDWVLGIRKQGRKCIHADGRVVDQRAASGYSRTMKTPSSLDSGGRYLSLADRAVHGHWEGDLIMGSNNKTAIGTLVKRATRYTMLVHIPHGHDVERVRDRLLEVIATLPKHVRGSLTWDHGSKMARHDQITMATDIQLYFCDPANPWQRGSNENTNGLLRQFFPEGTDLSVCGNEDREHVAQELNGRPRRRATGTPQPSACVT